MALIAALILLDALGEIHADRSLICPVVRLFLGFTYKPVNRMSDKFLSLEIVRPAKE